MYVSKERFKARMLTESDGVTLTGYVEVVSLPYGMVCAILTPEDFYKKYETLPDPEEVPVEPLPEPEVEIIPVPEQTPTE